MFLSSAPFHIFHIISSFAPIKHKHQQLIKYKIHNYKMGDQKYLPDNMSPYTPTTRLETLLQV